jgi:shikimate kinase
MIKSRNIFLIGPMGAGKSTIGRQLADLLKLQFFDSDREIEERCGASIDWIFDIEGEDQFRIREQKVIEELTEKSGIVLATGGGAVLSQSSREKLSARGTVIYLRATIDQQVERTEKDTRRPLLQVEDRREKIIELAGEREPLYREIADLVVDTDAGTVRSVASSIVKLLEEDAF